MHLENLDCCVFSSYLEARSEQQRSEKQPTRDDRRRHAGTWRMTAQYTTQPATTRDTTTDNSQDYNHHSRPMPSLVHDHTITVQFFLLACSIQ